MSAIEVDDSDDDTPPWMLKLTKMDVTAASSMARYHAGDDEAWFDNTGTWYLSETDIEKYNAGDDEADHPGYGEAWGYHGKCDLCSRISLAKFTNYKSWDTDTGGKVRQGVPEYGIEETVSMCPWCNDYKMDCRGTYYQRKWHAPLGKGIGKGGKGGYEKGGKGGFDLGEKGGHEKKIEVDLTMMDVSDDDFDVEGHDATSVEVNTEGNDATTKTEGDDATKTEGDDGKTTGGDETESDSGEWTQLE